ncbi:hypothetical protein F441_20452 [Phytophthora nicotianae CJ01A1]|uniref:Uncharacterized protein n=3 Tax=Phytophthora nicotianae TaxID=4792 RepID=W2QUH0_PHYN3|nr:hypothetical protein PPTG_21778 [Phytophthora nicotianae INRA-310]ETL79688.1 hypothetical protein L917_19737 [Phytophthora nicotianae]ETN16753.1 hypothetical protein PPTG_21778 [Phytophthora nicotianae INRA-310]ETP02496.1 hypothetical protein F441_20452 [Phytophthora nicotianae CJ01A1]
MAVVTNLRHRLMLGWHSSVTSTAKRRRIRSSAQTLPSL